MIYTKLYTVFFSLFFYCLILGKEMNLWLALYVFSFSILSFNSRKIIDNRLNTRKAISLLYTSIYPYFFRFYINI